MFFFLIKLNLLSDSGVYTCTASNDVSNIKHSAKINVFGPPSIRLMPNITAVAGERLMITCPVGGYPIDSITWEKGESIEQFDFIFFLVTQTQNQYFLS